MKNPLRWLFRTWPPPADPRPTHDVLHQIEEARLDLRRTADQARALLGDEMRRSG